MNGSFPTIRPALPSDVPAILPMVRAICTLHESWDPARYAMLPDVVDRYERWLPQRAVDPRSVLLVAELPHTNSATSSSTPTPIVGFLVGELQGNIPIYTLKEYAFIHDMWVEPSARRHGVGRALVLEAMKQFRTKGATQLRLETAAKNEPARKLFESCGMRVGTVDLLTNL
jgi:ribosomal protein S18 acetylase RimI-like enzyme